MATKPGSC